MRNISLKSDGVGDTLPAGDFNANLRTELQAIITDCGFTLDPEGGPNTDLDMLGKSIAVYSNASQYYADTGSADTYEINRVGNLQPLEQLIDGVIVYFKAANANTGPSTLDVYGMGAKDLVDNSGSALAGGEIISDQYVQARYNSVTDDFEIVTNNRYFLTTWENAGNDLIPKVSGIGNIGGISNLIEGIYLGDSARAYFGDGQDLQIYFDGSNSHIIADSGDINIRAVGANLLYLWTNDIQRWSINTAGHLIPGAASTYNIGNASNELGNIYQGYERYHYFGNSQEFSIGFGDFFSWGNDYAFFYSPSNTFLISGDNGIAFVTASGTYRWLINSSGNLLPGGGGLYDIGGSSQRVLTIYSTNVLDVSDYRFKRDIYESSLGLDFINKLNPVSFKLLEVDNDRTRFGLIAQDVNKILVDFNMTYDSFSGIHYDNENDRWDMDYIQFISPIIKSIQQLDDKIESIIKSL